MRRSTLASLLGAMAACSGPQDRSPGPEPGPVRVIVVGMDTVRADHMGFLGAAGGMTPSLDRLAAESIVFGQAWAPAPRTRPSFRSATTGRWPLSAAGAPTLGEILRPRGFRTGGFVANVQLSKELGFAEGFDIWALNNMATADQQVDTALEWLTEQGSEGVFLSLHVMDPHIFYTAPEPFRDRYTDAVDREGMPDKYNRADVLKLQQRGMLSDAQRRWIQGRYQGEISFMDQELGRLVEAVDRLPGETWMIFHSDHGEEFWDHGGFEHNHSLHDELLHAVLMIRPPKGAGIEPVRIDRPVSLVDIPPTVLSIVGMEPGSWPTFDGWDLSPLWSDVDGDALGKRLSQRPLQIGHMMYSKEAWGVIVGAEKYVVQTSTGEVSWTRRGAPMAGRNSALEGALSEATGWPVLQGYRVAFSMLNTPIQLRFERPITKAVVVDPEALLQRRANIAWGERPVRRPTDVAALEVSDDRRELKVVPGPQPSGVVFVALDPAGNPVRSACKGDVDAPLVEGEQSLCGTPVTVSVGPYLDLPPTEAPVSEVDDAASIETLKQLGYLD